MAHPRTVTEDIPDRPRALSDRKSVLDLRGLRTVFPGRDGPVTVVNEVSLSLARGETLAVVGESGSGKTMTFLSALGLLPVGGRVVGGEALLDGQDLLELKPKQLRALRGSKISMVFQDPLSGLNPVFRVGEQIADAVRAHRSITRAEARKEVIRLLERVHIPDPNRRINNFPHELSGGMRQRVLIAMAIALDPLVLVADEPTTALDVTIQAQILELLAEIQVETGMGLVLITHDLGLVARHADRVAVMYAGRVVERGDLDAIFKRHPPPLHGLLVSVRSRTSTLPPMPNSNRSRACRPILPPCPGMCVRSAVLFGSRPRKVQRRSACVGSRRQRSALERVSLLARGCCKWRSHDKRGRRRMKAELPTPQDEQPLLALHNVTKTFGAMNWFGVSAKTAVTSGRRGLLRSPPWRDTRPGRRNW